MTDPLIRLRNKIDQIDRDLLRLITERLAIVRQVGALKDSEFYKGRPIREADLLKQWLASAPEIPFPALCGISRILITTALMIEVPNFQIHAAAGLEKPAFDYYGAASPIFHDTAESLFAVQKAAHPNILLLLPLDDMRYWQKPYRQLLGGKLHIIEALPLDKKQKQAVLIAALPAFEYLPKNQLFLSENPDKNQPHLSSIFDSSLTLAHGFSIHHSQNSKDKLGDNKASEKLALQYIGSYSDSIIAP